MSARQEKRIARLEQQVADLLREVARISPRPGKGYSARLGVCFGETDLAINKDASGTVNIFDGPEGEETDTGETVEDVRNPWANVGAGKKVFVIFFRGKKYLLQAECPLA